MSKYFDQSVRARVGPAPIVEADPPDVRNQQAVLAVPPALAVAETKASPLSACGALEFRISDLLKTQFTGSSSLEQVQESYRVLRTRLLRLKPSRELRSIVVTSSVQGEGKTLTSLNLAVCCARLHDLSVLLVDSDIRSQGLTRLIGSPAAPGLSEVLAKTCRPEQAIMSADVPNLHLLTGGTPTIPPAELLASDRFQEFIAWCNRSFKLVILDSPPILNLPDVEVMTAACDGALMVVRAQKTPRDVLQKSSNQIDRKKLLGIVYNAAEGAHHYYTYSHKSAVEKSA